MASNIKTGWQVLLVAVWINFSETIRWMLYSKSKFEALYQSKGMTLPNGPVNLVLWVIWGVVIACFVFVLARRLSLLHATVLSWLAAFVTTWIILWNFDILPLDMLWVVVPLSVFEIFIAALISVKLQGHDSGKKR